MHRRIDIAAYDAATSIEAAAVERGKYLCSTRGCVDRHGAGRASIDDGSMRVKGANISPGPGNVVSKYTPTDWERTPYTRGQIPDAASIIDHPRKPPRPAGGRRGARPSLCASNQSSRPFPWPEAPRPVHIQLAASSTSPLPR
jgi:hypothetical protein